MFNVKSDFPKVLNIHFNKNKFRIELRGRITQIDGDSGSGKTLLCNVLKSIKSDIKYNNGIYDNYFNDIVVFNYKENFGGIEDLLNLKDKLIVIDRADTLDFDCSLSRYISSDRNNCYLILARGFINIGISPNCICELKSIDGIITTFYEFSEKGW